MKLLTLNTHSLVENDYLKKLNAFTKMVVRQMPNIVFLQEVMQPSNSDVANTSHQAVGSVPLKKGNHGLNVVNALKAEGVEYHLLWLGIKKSYDQFDEGLAILSKEPYDDIDEILLSPFDKYDNWKTRKALGIKRGDIWFYNVHMGWWDDTESPFQYELSSLLKGARQENLTFFAGDFNIPSTHSGYELILSRGLFDTYALAKERDDGVTAVTGIDGWSNTAENEKIRIDYIFANKKIEVQDSHTVFNGRGEMQVSDHCGILINI